MDVLLQVFEVWCIIASFAYYSVWCALFFIDGKDRGIIETRKELFLSLIPFYLVFKWVKKAAKNWEN